MALDKKALNEELLLWLGFTCVEWVWSYPDGITVDNGVPFFPESFDECIEWIVPKLQYLNIYYDKRLGFAVFIDAGKICYDKTGENLALAFCLAVQKLIRSEQC